MDGEQNRPNARRLRAYHRLIYDATVLTGVSAVTAGAYLKFGLAAGLITFGTLVLALSIYAAERLSGR